MSNRAPGRLRIVGGAWRSRLISFDTTSGVRPTPDRVRQTLFDWLAPRIEGARCLDLFAGSGALGFEALSRGAAHVNFVEQNRVQTEAIATTIEILHAEDRATLVCSEALRWLAARPVSGSSPHEGDRDQQFDVVFLDPPYATDLLASVLPLMAVLLKSDNRIYVEWPASSRPELPPGYHWLRERQAGQVSFGLITYTQEVKS